MEIRASTGTSNTSFRATPMLLALLSLPKVHSLKSPPPPRPLRRRCTSDRPKADDILYTIHRGGQSRDRRETFLCLPWGGSVFLKLIQKRKALVKKFNQNNKKEEHSQARPSHNGDDDDARLLTTKRKRPERRNESGKNRGIRGNTEQIRR